MTKTHRHAGNIRTRTYRAWLAMRERCSNEDHVVYKYYGGRGITVCDRWNSSFEDFLADMGPAPSDKHSIDRQHSDDNYEPGKCQWATKKQQNRNKRNNRIVEVGGRSMCLAQAAEEAGLSRSIVRKRLERGWSIERSLATQSPT